VNKLNQEIKERIEIINRGEVPEGYKKYGIWIVPEEWTDVNFKNIFEEIIDKTSDVEKYPLYSLTIEAGVTPKTERYERSFLLKKEEDNYKVVHKNDFVYNPMNLRFGALGRHKENREVCVSAYYNIFKVNNGYNPVFIEHYLKSHRLIYLYNKYATGSLKEKQRLHFSQFKNFILPLPNQKESDEISQILSSCDKGIELKEKLIAQKKEQKKGLMQNLLTPLW
jgi:type I restriction enzyme S subunit